MNILIFGPNGSGKGAQSSLIKSKLGIQHIEVGDLFRDQIRQKTPLGLQVQAYIDRGALVPDEITIPMMLDVLQHTDAAGWLLDGFPRNITQAKGLYESFSSNGMQIDHVVELTLDRDIARDRILGRRICTKVAHHPNNINVKAILPLESQCRVCQSPLKTRADDQDMAAIDQRHDIYYDQATGTLAAVEFLKTKPGIDYLCVDADREIDEIGEELLSLLDS